MFWEDCRGHKKNEKKCLNHLLNAVTIIDDKNRIFKVHLLHSHDLESMSLTERFSFFSSQFVVSHVSLHSSFCCLPVKMRIWKMKNVEKREQKKDWMKMLWWYYLWCLHQNTEIFFFSHIFPLFTVVVNWKTQNIPYSILKKRVKMLKMKKNWENVKNVLSLPHSISLSNLLKFSMVESSVIFIFCDFIRISHFHMMSKEKRK